MSYYVVSLKVDSAMSWQEGNDKKKDGNNMADIDVSLVLMDTAFTENASANYGVIVTANPAISIEANESAKIDIPVTVTASGETTGVNKIYSATISVPDQGTAITFDSTKKIIGYIAFDSASTIALTTGLDGRVYKQ